MKKMIKKPLGFFSVAIVVLIGVSTLDITLFHFLLDFFNILIGFMIFTIVLNSKVYTEKSIYLVIAVSYIYLSCFDLYHLITVYDISNIGINLNHSYQAFASARVFEAFIMIMVFGYVKSPARVNYKLSHMIGAFVLVGGMLLIGFDLIPEYYSPEQGQSVVKLTVSYITAVMFFLASYYAYNSEMNYPNKGLISIILMLKGLAQVVHASFIDMGDTFQVTAMILRFASYVGFYILIVKEIVSDPYTNIYSMFKTKEEELLNLSQRDSLTGIYNHSLTFQKIEDMINLIGRDYQGLSVILFDVDNFKQINDSYGHIKGDDMLRKFTSILKELYAPNKIVGRYGGDEFVLALPDANEDKIKELFKEVNIMLAELAYKDGVVLTFSAGVVTWRIGDNATDLIRKADIKMYESKDKGKNQYTIWEHDLKKVKI